MYPVALSTGKLLQLTPSLVVFKIDPPIPQAYPVVELTKVKSVKVSVVPDVFVDQLPVKVEAAKEELIVTNVKKSRIEKSEKIDNFLNFIR
jgi:hypothetical protein